MHIILLFDTIEGLQFNIGIKYIIEFGNPESFRSRSKCNYNQIHQFLNVQRNLFHRLSLDLLYSNHFRNNNK